MKNILQVIHKNYLKKLISRFKKSELWKRIFKNFSIGLLGSLMKILLNLAQMAILTKTLSVSNYGILMIVVNFYAFVNMILNVKINDFIFRFLPDFEEKKNSNAVAGIINLSLLISAIIIFITAILILTSSSWIADTFYSNPNIGNLLEIYLIAGVFSVLSGFSTGILRLKDKFTKIVIPQVFGALITVIGLIIYIFILGEIDLSIITGIMAFGTFLGLAIPFHFSLKLTKNERSNISFFKSLKSLSDYKERIVSTLFQTNIASYLKLGSETGGIFLLGVFGSSAQVALYNVAYQMVKPLKLLQSNVQPAIYPEIVKMYAERKYKSLKSMIVKITMTNVLVGGVSVIAAYFLVEPVIVMFTTSDYLEAVPVFLIIIFTIYLTFLSLCFYPLAVIMDKLKWRNFIVSLRFLFLGGVYLIGFTAVNVAWAQFIGSLTTRLFNDLPLFKKLNKRI